MKLQRRNENYKSIFTNTWFVPALFVAIQEYLADFATLRLIEILEVFKLVYSLLICHLISGCGYPFTMHSSNKFFSSEASYENLTIFGESVRRTKRELHFERTMPELANYHRKMHI